MELGFGDIEMPESNVDSQQPTAVEKLFKAIRKKHKINNPFTEEDRIREINECLREGANINAVDENDKKKTILHIAVQRGYNETVKFLVENGADISIESTDKETPEDIAKKLKNSVIETFLKGLVESGNDAAGKSADAKDKNQKGTEDGKNYEKLLITSLSAKAFECFKIENAESNPFGVGREVKVTEKFKFDDVVLKYRGQNNLNYFMFLQSKHKEKYHAINSEILSSAASSKKGMSKAFNLEKYFISYLEGRENLKNTKDDALKNGKIKYLVIFTNVDLDIKDLKVNGFRLKKAPADAIRLLNALKSEKHCHQLEKLNDELQKKLEKHSDLHNLAKELAKYIVDEKYKNEIMTMEDLIQHYHVVLGKEVITVDDSKLCRKNKRHSKRSITDNILSYMHYVIHVLYHIWFIYLSFPLFLIELCINIHHFTIKWPQKHFKGYFKDDFIDDENEESKRNLRNAMFQAIKELDKTKENASSEELKAFLKETELKLPQNFGKSSQEDNTELPTDDVTDFLNCLIYIVNQPHAEEYEKYVNDIVQDSVLKKTLSKHVFEKLKSVGPETETRIKKFMKIDEKAHHKECWLSDEVFKEIIQDMVQQTSVLNMIAIITIIYENDIMKWGLFNKLEKITTTLDDFLQNTEKTVLRINTLETALSSIKLLQYFSEKEGYRAEDGRISLNLNDLISKGYQNKVIEAFKLEGSNLLTVQCTETNQIQVLEEFYEELNKIIKNKPKKRIILVIQKDKRNILSEKLRTAGEYILEIDDEIIIKDFEPKIDPLKQQVILFPGQRKKISLSKLIGNSDWNSYLNESFKVEHGEGIIDESSLVQLLNGDEIIIGSEPPRVSNLEGAYVKLFEEINKETFRDKLLDDMSKDLFIVSGIYGSEKEKINELIHYLDIEHRRGEIEKKVGNIQSVCKIIQIEDDQFKDEQFIRLCKTYPDRNFFWIIMKNDNFVKNENNGKGENYSENKNKVKFILYQFYNPDFYFNRKFIDKVFITKGIKHQLINQDLSERFILSGVTDEEEFTTSFTFFDTEEVEQFRNNCSNGKITVVNNEQDANSYYQSLSEEQEVEMVHWLTFAESRLVWRNSYRSFQGLLKHIDNESGKEYFSKVFMTKEVKHQLLNPDRSEVFIISGVEDIDEFTKSFKFPDNDKEQQFKNSCSNGKIKVVNNELEAYFYCQVLSEEEGVEMVHWLTFEESRLVWHNSHGSLANLRKYIHEKQCKECLTEENILIKEIKDKKIVIIADDPGTGKSTTLTRLYDSRNESESILDSHWVIRINLRDHFEAIKDIDSENIDVNIVKQFLSKLDLNLNHSLVKKLLRIALNKKENSSMLSKTLLIAFDGFDELLDKEDRNKVISMLKVLKKESGVKFWITTRLHYKLDLEDALSTFAIEFHTIDEEKTQFITKYLKDRMSLILSKGTFEEVFDNNNKPEETTKITEYTNAFSNNMESVFRGSTSKFLGTPLQLYLLLEGSVAYFKNWIENYDSQPPNFDYLGKDILEVYQKFIERKYEIYFNKKNVKEQLRQRQDKVNFDRYCENLVKSTIHNSEHKKSLEEYKDMVLSTGIVKSQGRIYEFIHPTFTEYFAAQLYIHWIEKPPNVLQNSNKQEYLLREIFMKSDYKLIRMFMNIKLKEKIEKGKISEKKLKLYGEIISKLWNQTPEDKRKQEGSILDIAVTEDNKEIVNFIFNCLEKVVNSQEIIAEFLLFKRSSVGSAFCLALFHGSDEIFELMLRKIDKHLDENLFFRFIINNKICMFINEKIFPTILRKERILMLLDLVKRKLSDENFRELFGQTDLHRAVIKNNKDKVSLILKSSVLDKNYLFTKDSFQKTVLHYSVSGKKKEFTKQILEKAQEISPEEELKLFLCERDLEGNTVFDIAVKDLNFEITELILGATKCLDSSTEICELLRNLNDDSQTSESKSNLLNSLLPRTEEYILEDIYDVHTYLNHLYGPEEAFEKWYSGDFGENATAYFMNKWQNDC